MLTDNNGPSVKQAGRECAPAVSMAGTGHASHQAHATFAEKLAAADVSGHNYFNRERHLCSRSKFKLNRSAALGEGRELGAT